MKNFVALTQTKINFAETNLDLCNDAVASVRSKAKQPPFLAQTSTLTTCRAMVFGLMSGTNGTSVNEVEFLAGVNRFGITNPTPIIKKRIALYGNSQETLRLLQTLSGATDDYQPAEFAQAVTNQEIAKDLKETTEPKPYEGLTRLAGVQDIKLLASQKL